jgi:hypothetical protein
MKSPHWGCNVGAASELMVCANLLSRGWYVFRSVSPTAPCDLVAMKYGSLIRVEVKTGQQTNYGKVVPRSKKGLAVTFDVLAVVYEGVVTYTPSLDELDGL